MATRKRPPDQPSLFVVPRPVEPLVEVRERESTPEPASETTPAVAERILRLLPTIDTPEEGIIIEPAGDGRFWLTFLRHHGTTRGAILVTRAHLEMLLRRIPAALEVGS